MRRAFSVIAFICIFLFGSARSIWIKDNDYNLLQGVIVSIISPNDTIMTDVQISDQNGHVFLPDSIPPTYIIKAQYRDFMTSEMSLAECLDTIKLSPKANMLDELTVVANKDQIRSEAGKLIFTPGSLKTEVNNMFDLLRYVPLVESESNNLKISGKGDCLIYINGRDTQLPKEQIIGELKMLPPSWIKSVELIVAPGAGYSASSNTGIININLIDRRKGAWARISADGSFGDMTYGTMDNATLSFTHKRFRASASAWFMGGRSGMETTQTFHFENSETSDVARTRNVSREITDNTYVSGNLFLSYDLSKRSVIGGGVSLGGEKNTNSNRTESVSTGYDGLETASNSETINRKPWHIPNFYCKLFYTLDTDSKGSRLEASGLYHRSRNKSEIQYLFEDLTDEQRNNKGEGGFANIKYRHKFSSRHSGLLGYSYTNSVITDFNKTQLQTTEFRYKEIIHAAFVDFESRWSDIFSTRVGLRLEHDINNGSYINGEELYSRKSTGLFPSFSATVAFPSGNHYLSADISRMIYRPQFEELNPFPIWTSENTCVSGNPELKAATRWNFSITYNFLQHYLFLLSYSIHNNLFSRFIYGDSGVTYTKPVNWSDSQSLYARFEYNNAFSKVWRCRIALNGSMNRNKYLHNDVLMGGTSWSGHILFGNRFHFDKSLMPDIECDVEVGYSGQYLWVGAELISAVSLALSKEIIPNLNARLSISSNLGRLRKAEYRQPDYSYDLKTTSLPLWCYLSLSYTFGRQHIINYEDYSDDSYNSRY